MNKSKHGSIFKKEVLDSLILLKNQGHIDTIETNKRIKYGSSTKPQFFAPFYVSVKNKNIIFFTTTSARSDRIKINQWDAKGIKMSLPKETYCYLLLPNDLNKIEQTLLEKESVRIAQQGYVTALDKIIQLRKIETVLQ
jgi:hypothetical protein